MKIKTTEIDKKDFTLDRTRFKTLVECTSKGMCVIVSSIQFDKTFFDTASFNATKNSPHDIYLGEQLDNLPDRDSNSLKELEKNHKKMVKDVQKLLEGFKG